MSYDNESVPITTIILSSIGGIVLLCLFILFMMWGCPTYNVWHSEMSGKAELAQADYNRQIAVREASAKQEAAQHLAAAEVERAKGVAQANQIIGKSLNENEAYLRYLWIETLHDSDTSVVYVPTEANLPILEANRSSSKK